MTVMDSTFMDSAAWDGRIYLDGWRAGGGGERAVIEPATGGELGRVGMANPADVAARAAARAAEAQRAWAAESGTRSARLCCARRAISGRTRRGGPGLDHARVRRDPPMGPRQTRFAASTCHDSSGLATLPYGELLRTVTRP